MIPRAISPLVLAGLLALATPVLAQAHPDHPYENNPIKIFHLANVVTQNEANEIMIALRNMEDPRDKIYLVASTNDIVLSAPPEEIARVTQLIADLDRPKKTYRLTFTLNESDNGKRIGVQHFSLVAVPGQRTILKQGDKVPVLTSSSGGDPNAASAPQNQVTYLDIGINLDVTLDEFAHGLRLRSKVEQSAVAPESVTGKLPGDPVVRQSLLEGTSAFPLGKPLVLGAIDIVGSTRHLDIEVLAEPLP